MLDPKSFSVLRLSNKRSRCCDILSTGALYAYQERRDGKDETIDLYQIAIFIKQIAFASMDAGGAKRRLTRLFLQQWGKSWELASKLLLDPMEGMKLAVELFDHGNNSLKLYGMLLRNYRVAKKRYCCQI